MAISGFGAQNNLKLTKPLNLNQVNQQVQVQEEETKNVETNKVDLQAPAGSLGQVKFDQVESLLIGNGIKINRPEQPEEPKDAEMKLNSHFKFDSEQDFLRSIGHGIYKDGDTMTYIDSDGKKVKCHARTNMAGEIIIARDDETNHWMD